MHNTTRTYHTPALATTTIDGLDINPTGIYVDATFGGGGHSSLILSKLTTGRLIAFDRDADALRNMPEDNRLTLVNHDFIHLRNYLRFLEAMPVDGILADLGISSHQIDEAERGFSFRFDAPLDMRMDKNNPITAATLINDKNEAELQEIFSRYGEIKNAKTLARTIVNRRALSRIDTTFQLAMLAQECIPAHENINKYLAPVFQALRIAVNKELEGLESFLVQSLSVLKKGGKLAIITYHSLEDRPVKNFFQTGNMEGKSEKDMYGHDLSPWKMITKKPITPSDDEVNANPRVRSAKLRIAEKL